MSIPIKKVVSRSVDFSFRVLSDLLKFATFKKVVSYTPDPFTGLNVNVYVPAGVNYLPLLFSTVDADGTSIVYGDEKWLIKASELATISPQPSSGDAFDANGSHYDVKAALLDPSESLWTFQVRRLVPQPVASSPDQDFGDLTRYDSLDDWASVASLHNSSDDWNITIPDIALEDRGDLAAFTTSEDWGGFTALDSPSEDWNNT